MPESYSALVLIVLSLWLFDILPLILAYGLKIIRMAVFILSILIVEFFLTILMFYIYFLLKRLGLIRDRPSFLFRFLLILDIHHITISHAPLWILISLTATFMVADRLFMEWTER